VWCHELTAAFSDVYGRLGDAAIDALAVVYRRARARESLLLATHLNKVKATTYSLHFEPVDLLARRAPPAPGGATMESDFTNVFVHFVKDYVLPDWTMVSRRNQARRPGTKPTRLKSPKRSSIGCRSSPTRVTGRRVSWTRTCASSRRTRAWPCLRRGRSHIPTPLGKDLPTAHGLGPLLE
jgi:hypothetical protein